LNTGGAPASKLVSMKDGESHRRKMSYRDRFRNGRPSPRSGSAHPALAQLSEAVEAAANAPTKQGLETRIVAAQKVVQRDWDTGFLESLAEQLAKGRTLSPKQVETLAKIEHRNNPDVLHARARWQTAFTDEMRSIAKVCARYYEANPPYFGDLAGEVLRRIDTDFTPTEKQYKAMCENKYALKVRAATYDAPVFPVGTLVGLRSTAPYNAKSACTVGSALVLSVGARPVTSGAKGAKTYEILPVGGAIKVQVEERHLKKMRMPKKK
jgi:hypothetical protein